MNRRKLFLYAVGIILMIGLLSIYLIALRRPAITPAGGSLVSGKQTTVASTPVTRTNQQETATSIPPSATAEQSTVTTSSLGSGNRCGNINLTPSGKLRDTTNVQQIENCFWQAYQQCRPVSLTLTFIGTDMVSKHTFSLTQQNGGCLISDVVQGSFIGQPTPQQDTYTCTQLEDSETALHFVNCGDEGTIDIPHA
jgi:hypothetical protein